MSQIKSRRKVWWGCIGGAECVGTIESKVLLTREQASALQLAVLKEHQRRHPLFPATGMKIGARKASLKSNTGLLQFQFETPRGPQLIRV